MNDIYFERVKRFANDDSVQLPERQTSGAAGYDFYVAEDVTLPSYSRLLRTFLSGTAYGYPFQSYTLNEAKVKMKNNELKPILVSTGVKCHMPKNVYLELVVRSSLPLNSGIILANSVGIIDSDYYSNPSNDGEIMLQLYNTSPFDIVLHKGDRIGQGIFKEYLTTRDDNQEKERTGGFGSTNV